MSVMINKISKPKGSILKGYPPGDVTNIQITPSINYVGVNYKLPVDIEICGTVLSEWQEVKLVQNNNHYPTSIDDGIPLTVATRTDTNSGTSNYVQVLYNTTITTAYFRFFVVSKTGEINDSTSMMFEGKRIVADPVLANNSWETIAAISESGQASSIWQIGDEIPVTLGEDTYTAQIWDFDHYDLSDGSGKAGITFGFKELFNTPTAIDQYKSGTSTIIISACYPGTIRIANNSNYSTEYGKYWSPSYTTSYSSCKTQPLNSFINVNIYNKMPQELQSVIKTVDIHHAGATGKSNSNLTASRSQYTASCKIFIPCYSELQDNTYGYELDSFKFPIFSDNNSRKRSPLNNAGANAYWWTRTSTNLSNYAYKSSLYYRVANYYTYIGGAFNNDIIGCDNAKDVYLCPIFNV